jgi:hypothetical protein
MSPGGASVDAEVVASGTYSARLSRASADAAPAFVRQTLATVEPGRRYELSAATRCDSFGRELRIAIEWLKGDRLLATDEIRDQTFEAWQRKRVASTCPPEATRADVVLELVSAGTVWFDDVSLSALETVAEVTLDIRKPNPRGLIRQGVDAPSVTLRPKWAAAIPGARCALLISGPGEKREMPLAADAESMTVDMAGLPLGQYALRAEVRGPEGAVLASDDATVDIVPPDAHGVFFRDDHIAVVDGAPWFPIGLTSISPTDEEAAGLAQAGFNLLVTGTISQGTAEEMRAVLDRASVLGIRVIEWNNGWVYGGLTAEAREAAARKMAENAGDHPAFLGSACDEAIWNGIPLRDVESAYLLCRRLLPTRLFWQNQAPRNTIEDLARYCRAADVTGMDIYPVDMPDHSDMPNKTLSVVGDEVEKNIATVEGKKPVWAILQGFGWFVWSGDPATHKRAPNWAETRFMAYDAILRGAVGVIYWGASYEKRDAEIWTHLRRIAGELRDLTPALVARERLDVPVSAPDGGVTAIGRLVDGKAYIIAANESGAPRQATFTLPEGHGRFVRWGEEGPSPAIEGSALRDAFEAYGAHVYREE